DLDDRTRAGEGRDRPTKSGALDSREQEVAVQLAGILLVVAAKADIARVRTRQIERQPFIVGRFLAGEIEEQARCAVVDLAEHVERILVAARSKRDREHPIANNARLGTCGGNLRTRA